MSRRPIRLLLGSAAAVGAVVAGARAAHTPPREGSGAAPRRNEFGQPIGAPAANAARPAEPVTLEGRTCRLEPLRREHAPGLLASLRAAGGDEAFTYMAWEPARTEAQMAAIVDGLVDDPAFLPFAIVTPGGVAGTASYLRIAPGTGSIEVGSIMYGAGARRAAPATEAMYLLARHAFDELGYRRYEWKCDALNAPSRAAALRLGFAYEGTWRNALVYKGRNRDTAWYAMTDADWARLRPGYEDWLAGLDGTGRQARPLSVCLASRGGAHRLTARSPRVSVAPSDGDDAAGGESGGTT